MSCEVCGAHLLERHSDNEGTWFKCKNGHWVRIVDVGKG